MGAGDVPRMRVCGESAVSVQFGDQIDPRVNARVHRLVAALRDAAWDGFGEAIPAYTTLLVQFDPLRWSTDEVTNRLERLLMDLDDVPGQESGRLVEIPVVYGGAAGPDLEALAAAHGLTLDEVVALHALPEYRVYMIGFTPGFPYMGGLDDRIATPRRATPRTTIPAGSVGIAGAQTGIYPLESPGGWQIIGRTRLVLFDPQRDPPSLLAPGDRVRFVPIKGAA